MNFYSQYTDHCVQTYEPQSLLNSHSASGCKPVFIFNFQWWTQVLILCNWFCFFNESVCLLQVFIQSFPSSKWQLALHHMTKLTMSQGWMLFNTNFVPYVNTKEHDVYLCSIVIPLCSGLTYQQYVKHLKILVFCTYCNWNVQLKSFTVLYGSPEPGIVFLLFL